jgi:hypothetical protein
VRLDRRLAKLRRMPILAAYTVEFICRFEAAIPNGLFAEGCRQPDGLNSPFIALREDRCASG